MFCRINNLLKNPFLHVETCHPLLTAVKWVAYCTQILTLGFAGVTAFCAFVTCYYLFQDFSEIFFPLLFCLIGFALSWSVYCYGWLFISKTLLLGIQEDQACKFLPWQCVALLHTCGLVYLRATTQLEDYLSSRHLPVWELLAWTALLLPQLLVAAGALLMWSRQPAPTIPLSLDEQQAGGDVPGDLPDPAEKGCLPPSYSTVVLMGLPPPPYTSLKKNSSTTSLCINKTP